MRRLRTNLRTGKGKDEQGVIITLVAVFMLFVIGAMAALSIDVVTIYTARSEAQLVADSAALAAARVLANSGLTSTAAGPAGAEAVATTVATQVGTANSIGGGAPTTVAVSFNHTASSFATDPQVTVAVSTSLPTFFARIWGRTQITIGASATAEAYNPSAPNLLSTGGGIPIAPLCVKPWLLPNMDPTSLIGSAIFDPTSGFIDNPTLVGQSWPNTTVANPNPNGIYSLCNGGDCSVGNGGITAPSPGAYYPGAIDAADFPAPTQAPPSCSSTFKPYQFAVAGCVQRPIRCGALPDSSITIDTTAYGTTRDADTVAAAACLIHYTNPGDSDSIDTSISTLPPFQFLAGNQNPVVVGKDVMVSDSLVTIPVINYPPGTPPTSTVAVIGFLQVFLNPSATSTMPYTPTGPASAYEISATIINMAGCGTSATGQPILGNGASPVVVRLISPP